MSIVAYSPAEVPPAQARQINSPASKMEIVGLLAARHGFTRYLELCTATTGWHYAALDRRVLTSAHRLMYNCPAQFDDGHPIDFRSESFDISECIAEIRRRRMRFDIILVDPWHEFHTSSRDLNVAFDLIDDGGILVVHDCVPPDISVATPHFIPGSWCGVTYKAFLYFVSIRRALDYHTVDIDYGCGVIRKRGRRRSYDLEQFSLWQQWLETENDHEQSFRFFDTHKKALLNLVGPDEFLAAL